MFSAQMDLMSVEGLAGRVVFTCFPGRGADNEFHLERMERVFETLVAGGASTLVSLVENVEFEAYCGRDVFGARALVHGLTWHHLAVPDMQAPDEAALDSWEALSLKVLAELKEGRDVCVHCKGGLGRTGTLVAMLLMDHGYSHDAAIAAVRAARKGAIESDVQEAFLRSYRRLE